MPTKMKKSKTPSKPRAKRVTLVDKRLAKLLGKETMSKLVRLVNSGRVAGVERAKTRGGQIDVTVVDMGIINEQLVQLLGA